MKKVFHFVRARDGSADTIAGRTVSGGLDPSAISRPEGGAGTVGRPIRHDGGHVLAGAGIGLRNFAEPTSP